MQLQISGISQTQCQQFLGQAKKLLDTTRSALRLSEVFDKKTEQRVLYLRERTWGEFFLEKLLLTPQEIEDIQNESIAAIELAFFSLAEQSRVRSEENSNKSEEASVPCLDDLADEIVSENQKTRNDKNLGDNTDINLCKDFLRWRVLGEDEPEVETQFAELGNVLTFNGLFTVPEGVSISTCPGLQVIAHRAVVRSIGAVSLPKVTPYSPLERASEAFANAWAAWKLTSLPCSSINPNNGKEEITVSAYHLESQRGLKHIQHLQCIPDNRNRSVDDCLANQPEAVWTEFYSQGCGPVEGSIVFELYPDYYIGKIGGGEKLPFYSDENIQGAIAAANKIRSQVKQKGKGKASIMFAGMDNDTYTRMSKMMNPPPRPKFPEYLLTPEKIPQNVRGNSNLQNAVRLVPEIRKNLIGSANNNAVSDTLEISSDSED